MPKLIFWVVYISKHLQLLIGLIKAHTLYKKGLSMLHFRFSIHTLYKKGLSMLHFRFSINSNKHILVHYFWHDAAPISQFSDILF